MVKVRLWIIAAIVLVVTVAFAVTFFVMKEKENKAAQAELLKLSEAVKGHILPEFLESGIPLETLKVNSAVLPELTDFNAFISELAVIQERHPGAYFNILQQDGEIGGANVLETVEKELKLPNLKPEDVHFYKLTIADYNPKTEKYGKDDYAEAKQEVLAVYEKYYGVTLKDGDIPMSTGTDFDPLLTLMGLSSEPVDIHLYRNLLNEDLELPVRPVLVNSFEFTFVNPLQYESFSPVQVDALEGDVEVLSLMKSLAVTDCSIGLKDSGTETSRVNCSINEDVVKGLKVDPDADAINTSKWARYLAPAGESGAVDVVNTSAGYRASFSVQSK